MYVTGAWITLVGINFLAVKRWVIFIDLTLLNPNMVTKFVHHLPLSRQEPLNSKTTFLVRYISGMIDLVGQITACVFVEYFCQ
jgi:hypothetical protein